jgi:hypothetical protein
MLSVIMSSVAVPISGCSVNINPDPKPIAVITFNTGSQIDRSHRVGILQNFLRPQLILYHNKLECLSLSVTLTLVRWG